MNEKSKTNEKVSSIYFIGIGGIGMSALARYFHSKGAKVSGYDKTSSSLTKELEQEGMQIHYEENVDVIPKDAELVVYTPAVPKEQKELVYYQQNGYKVVKRSDVLQIVTESSFNICIAGTHGKTTITTMVAHLLRHTGYGCNAFLGGISVNYGTNFWSSDRNVSVVEADEYDRSFLKLSPDVAIITAMDPDHLDIYGTPEEMGKAFIDFSGNIKEGGLLISKYGLKRAKDLKGSRHLTYSVQNKNADAHADNIKMMNGSYEFDVIINEKRIENVKLHVGGMHNVENAVAAIAVVSSLNIDKEKIKAAVEDFKGVKRRFEYIIKTADLIFIDDYAHHPEELRALINGAKSLFSKKKCTVIFQPHLYTRTKDLADGFAEVLDMADEIILLPIYPARELPIAGVSSKMILDKMKNKNKRVLNKEELKDWIRKDFKKQGNVLVTAGAGDIDLLIEPIKQILK
jgi:UDP-N-acetylmuramate--alanine ligase